MGDLGRPFRPIAPRTMPPGGGPGGDKPPGGGNGVPPEEGKMKRASTACKECQKRRTRCSGMPCTECVAHGRECVTDELSDRRRKAAAKKTQEELADLRGFVEQVLDIFRSNDETHLQHFINTVRAGASTEQIRATVEQLRGQRQSQQPQQQQHPQQSQPPQPQAPILPHPHQGPPNPVTDMDPNMMNPNMGNYYSPHPQH
ncbi:hypothetical protein N7532_008487 [Penicillium argentinense]|uniref:Zn(2)-C6 fungal-type domain-containing protein n=1 Tax=Penicillium argentinense TaxID=1131581 RepID=A0A9W9K1N4_9EURO|nr:uncharacterized protein N7532_008487 [Penicillium argentinense]KAJ5089803.1 hypothetical protein N7532_008487 [Penicillium argentinense]